jgi:hypothetical protein
MAPDPESRCKHRAWFWIPGSRASRVPGMSNEKPFASEAAIGGLAAAIAQFKS